MIGMLILFAVAAGLIVAVGSAVTIHRVTRPPRMGYAVAVARSLPTKPEEAGLAAVDTVFRLPDGNRTPGWVIAGRNPAGPVVIVSHGWGDSRIGALGFVPPLARHASRVVLYDLRGQGESTARASDLGIAEVDDLLAIIDQLDRGGRPVVLFGASMGGGISIAAAAKDHEKIAGVICDGAYRQGMEPIVGFFRVNRLPVWPFYFLVGAHLAFWFAPPARFDRAAHAARMRCPLLMLHGTADPICPCKSAQEIAAAAPDSKTVLFEGGGHLDLAAFDQKRYLDALESFFAGIAPTPSPSGRGPG